MKGFLDSVREALRWRGVGGSTSDGESRDPTEVYECPACGAMIIHPDGDTCSQCHAGRLREKR